MRKTIPHFSRTISTSSKSVLGNRFVVVRKNEPLCMYLPFRASFSITVSLKHVEFANTRSENGTMIRRTENVFVTKIYGGCMSVQTL